MKTAAVAGTFDVLHAGHKALIRRAFEVGDSVIIGITSDEFASVGRDEHLPLYLRRRALEEYLADEEKPWRIEVIDDIYGPRERMDAADILVVSEETLERGKELNRERASRGVKPLELSVVPLVMADDGRKISARDILDGMYGTGGHRDVKDVAVGSLNRVKVEAVRSVFEKIYGDVRITACDVESGVPSQPFEGQTRQGAVNRARNALGDHEMAVGIEAGVFEREDGLYDYQYCAVLDKDGRLTVGTGPGFMYPPEVAKLVRAGSTVGEAVGKIFGDNEAGKKMGAVGLLSGGLLDRKRLTEQAVTAAMIPRLNDSYLKGSE
ncbi:MAG: inosine/xanthosine triphosphatase [Methanomethylophilus sp.]|jgi:inosine/xanthosine triphosphatase